MSDDLATGGVVPKGKPLLVREGDCVMPIRTPGRYAASSHIRMSDGRSLSMSGTFTAPLSGVYRLFNGGAELVKVDADPNPMPRLRLFRRGRQ